MTNFAKYLEKNNIYKSHKLQQFFLELESKYTIINSFEHHNQLVNFSKNKGIPIHEWFKYREGFSAHLINELIDDANIKKNEIVVDPFVGSGTTLVSAVTLGYDALGIDVNPMSSLISKVKSTKYSKSQLKKVKNLTNILAEKFNTLKYTEINNVVKYFNVENYVSLRKIFSFISEVTDEPIYDILFCAYLSIIEESSNRKRDGNGLKTIPTKVSNVLETYINKVTQIVNDIVIMQDKLNGKSYVYTGSALELSKYYNKDDIQKKVGTIIFSPPYANSFDYFESYKLELWMGGFIKEGKTINDYRNTAIRSFIGREKENNPDEYVKLLADEINDAIPIKEKETGKKDARTRKVPQMIEGYFKDMDVVLGECYKILRKKSKCYIVIDQSSYLGKVVPSDLLVAYLGEKHGFKVEKIIECRIAKTSGQQVKKYPYLKEMLRESIVILTK